MIRLIGSCMHRLTRKNVPAWLTLLSALIAGAYGGNFGRPYQHYEYSFEPERLFWVLPIPLILLVITVFRSIRQEYSNGAIRNKIVAGHSKTAVYAAYMSAVLIFSAMTALLCLVPFRMLAVKGLRYLKEMPGKSAERMLMIYLLVFLLTGTLCGLCSLLTSRHSYAVTALVTLSILNLISGLSLSWKLNRPETIRQRTGAGDTEEVPNPDYVTSPKRELLSFFSRCNPLCALDAARSSAQSGLSMYDLRLMQQQLEDEKNRMETEYGYDPETVEAKIKKREASRLSTAYKYADQSRGYPACLSGLLVLVLSSGLPVFRQTDIS